MRNVYNIKRYFDIIISKIIYGKKRAEKIVHIKY
jgi:hypothetical protein